MPLKSIVDKAVAGADCVEKVFVFTATGAEVRGGQEPAVSCFTSLALPL